MEDKKFAALMMVWQNSGGTFADLVATLQTEQGIKLAATCDLTEEEVAEFVALSDKVDAMVAEMSLKAAPATELEDRRSWVKRVVRGLVSKQREWVKLAETGNKPTGTAKKPSVGGKKELPEAQAKQLRRWLEAGQPMSEFFEINEDLLGNAADYELRPFVEDDAGWIARINEE